MQHTVATSEVRLFNFTAYLHIKTITRLSLDGISTFVRDGAELLSKGGTFQIEYSDDLRIEEVYFSMANASAYAAIYGDFYIIDGTFNTNRYGLTDAKLTIVDGLGKSVVVGDALVASEHSKYVRKALRIFKLDTEGIVAMSDEAGAFALAIAERNQVHHLCCHHFMSKLPSSAASMRGLLKDQYIADCQQLVYNSFGHRDELNAKVEECLTKYKEYPSAIKFIIKIKDDQHKICATYTKKHFTAGHTSSQRAESMNSTFKEGGKSKSEFANFTLPQHLQQVTNIHAQHEMQAIATIRELIQKEKRWSTFVQNLWTKQFNEMTKYVAERTSGNDEKQV